MNVIVKLVNHTLGPRKMERLITLLNKVKYAILTVKVYKLRRLYVALTHISMGNLGLQMCYLVKFQSYSSLHRSQSPRCSA